MSPDSPKLLVVSNPAESAEIAGLLARGGFPEPLRGSGGDDTLALFQKSAPDVVVLAAELEEGDAGALAAAMQSGEYGRAARIVLVGAAAADFEVDRVVGGPLTAETLAAAVRACLSEAVPAVIEDAASVERTQRRIAEATDRAIDSFVSDAIDLLGAVAGQPAPPTTEAWKTPPPREPTLILSGQRRVAVTPVDSTSEAAPEPEAPPLRDDLDEELDVGAKSGPVDLDGLGTGELDTGPAPRDDEPGDEPPSGNALARELRRKMSAMAARLFPGEASVDVVDVRPGHDAHTEIDLAAVGDTAVGLAEEIREMPPVESFDEPVDSVAEADTRELLTSPRQRRATGTPHRGRLGGEGGDIAGLIARFATTSFTGRLVVRKSGVEKAVHFHDGRPVFATSNVPHDRMGDLLFREGKITRGQHAECCDLVEESGRRMGEILVELGFLKPRELLPAVRRHLEDVLYSIFSWTDGEFEAVAGAASEERIRLSRHPAALVLEGVRRKYELPRLIELVGASSAVVVARSTDKLGAIVGLADLTPGEKVAIDFFDGERSLEEVAAAARLDLLGVYQLAYALIALGVAELLDRGDTPAEPAGSRGSALVGETDLAIDRQRVRAKHAMVECADYFMLLGVRRDATGFEIRRAYESARRDYAAESFPLEIQRELEAELADIAELLDEAYDVLVDDATRQAYAANLRD